MLVLAWVLIAVVSGFLLKVNYDYTCQKDSDSVNVISYLEKQGYHSVKVIDKHYLPMPASMLLRDTPYTTATLEYVLVSAEKDGIVVNLKVKNTDNPATVCFEKQ